MANNLPDNLKTNWVDNETVMPVNVNGWSSAINKIKDAIPVYSANGNFYTATYGSNVYSLSPITMNGETNVPPSAYIDGMKVVFKCPTNNSANCSVNVNSLGNKAIKNLDGSNIGAGVLVAGNYIELIYDNSQGYFKLLTAHYLPISSVAGKGSASLPVYFDANGKAQPITSYEGNSATATKANQDANGDVIDVTYAKNENLFNKMNQSKAMETGSVSYVEEVLQDVIKYKNSSFDRSKFTDIGSPNITDDGILTPSVGNGMSTPTIQFLNKSFDITIPITFTGGISSAGIFDFGGIFTYQGASAGDGALTLPTSLTGLSDVKYFSFSITPYVPAYFKLSFDSNSLNFAFNIIQNNTVVYTGSITLIATVPNSEFRLRGNWGNNALVNIDLKGLEIKLDDILVFNGHQEGIDVLKPNDFTTVTTIYAYKFGDNTVYSNVTNNTNPTELYNADGSYYLGTAFDIINDKVTYPEQATRGTDDITIEGVTYYEFEHTTGGSSTNIYADDPTTPTALFNSDGSEYTGTQWNIMSSKVYYLNDATYTSSANITINRDYNTVDAGVKISDDGIASGFRATSVIQPTYSFNNASTANSWEVYVKLKTGNSVGGNQNIFATTGSNYSNLRLISSKLKIEIGGGSSSLFNLTSIATLQANTVYYAKFVFTGTKYQIWLSTDGITYTLDNEGNSTDKFVSQGTWSIGSSYNMSQYAFPFLGTIDLNAFKIYVDDNLVYQPMLKIPYTQSASKYGSKIVDEKYRNRVEDAYGQGFEQRYFTLQENKKTNYTVVGSPTISSDFVASGFSTVDKITFSGIRVGNSDWWFYGSFTSYSNQSDNNRILDSSSTGIDFRVNSGNTSVAWLVRANSTNVFEPRNVDISISNNVKYYYKIGYESGAYKLYIGTALNNLSLIDSYTPVTTIGNYVWAQTVGAYPSTSPDRSFNGSIDLKDFKIYVDNKISYQAVTAPNFTLPLGELYGLIESKVPKTSLKEVICIVEDYTYEDASAFCWDLSNGIRIQGATQTVSANGKMTVPLLKNFADNHYLAFKNYSAGVSSAMQDNEGSIFDKTTSSFKTSNASGDTTKFDWIAIGKIG